MSPRNSLSHNQKLSLYIAGLAILATIVGSLISSHDWFQPPSPKATSTWTPTPTLTPTPTITPLPTITPTATPPPTLDVSAWPSIFEDKFDGSTNGWTGNGKMDQLSWTANIMHSKYVIEMKTEKGNVWYPFAPNFIAPDSFYYAIDMQFVNASQDDAGALIFRYFDKEKYYTFETKVDSEKGPVFRVRRFSPEARDVLMDWTPIKDIKLDEVNRFGVLGKGTQYQFYINGYCVAKISDSGKSNDTYPTGKIGVFGRLDQPKDVLQMKFDNAEVRVPSDLGNVPCP